MPPPPLANEFRQPWVRLLAAVAVMAALWLVGLPYLGRQPSVRRYINENEARGIDPSAKFYTELPGMPAFYSRIDDARRREQAAFGMAAPLTRGFDGRGPDEVR
jgi:hypothetical protein